MSGSLVRQAYPTLSPDAQSHAWQLSGSEERPGIVALQHTAG
jgi:hypothetical protein